MSNCHTEAATVSLIGACAGSGPKETARFTPELKMTARLDIFFDNLQLSALPSPAEA
jgi:hypothetical protein